MYIFPSYYYEEDVTATIKGKEFQRLMELCFAEATHFSLQRGAWESQTDTVLEDALKPFLKKEIKTVKWFGYDLSTAPMGDEWEMNISIYEATLEAKNVLMSYVKDVFMGYAVEGIRESKYTLEDLCFLKDEEFILGTVSHESMLYVYPPNDEFTKELLNLSNWIKKDDFEGLA